MKASDLMTRDPACCTPSTSLRDCARLMRDCDCGEIPVVEDMDSRILSGVITDRDIAVRAVAEGWDPNSTRVERCYSHPAITVNEDTDVDTCEHIMRERQLRRLPVVDEGGRCQGIVSQADIARKVSPEDIGRVVSEVSRENTTRGTAEPQPS